jgi:hypothetical protein
MRRSGAFRLKKIVPASAGPVFEPYTLGGRDLGRTEGQLGVRGRRCCRDRGIAADERAVIVYYAHGVSMALKTGGFARRYGMTLTLKIDPTLEQRLREQAAKRGVNPDSYAVAAIEEKLLLDSRLPAPITHEESELLTRINFGLPEETWERYDQLTEKRRAEKLTTEEHRELMRITNAIEEDHARRLGLVVQLARLRHVPLEALIEQLGVKPRDHRDDDHE